MRLVIQRVSAASVKIKDNLGVFAEGRYLNYWERPAYDIKLGVNYQFMGW